MFISAIYVTFLRCVAMLFDSRVPRMKSDEDGSHPQREKARGTTYNSNSAEQDEAAKPRKIINIPHFLSILVSGP
jgi:hypothetical protein